MLTSTDAKGITTSYTYDALDRLLTVSYPDSTQNVALKYDEPNSVTGCPTSASVGRLTRIVENSVTTVFCYDFNGHVTQKSQTVNGKTDITTYTRSPAGRLLTVTYPSGNMISFTRDGAGRVSGVSVTTSTGTKTLASNITHLPFGPISSYTLGNGQTVTRTHDANYRMTDLVSPAVSLHAARDAAGNVTAIGNSPGANPASETYTYDPLQRLTAITGANGTVTESVTYNHTGDRLSKAGSGLATGNYGYNPGTHQLIATGTDTRSVDANGNTTAITQAGNSYSFSYNNRNRLSAAQVNAGMFATYLYNANGERVAKTVNNATERFSYDEDGQLLGEYGITNRDYVWLEDIPLANIDMQGGSTSIAYVTADHQGTPRAITDESGSVLWQWPFAGNAWGEQAPISNGYIYNLRFAGQYSDAETGFVHNGMRDYCPECGRFHQSDPTGLFGGQASTYAYGNNNPLLNIDPLGLQDTLPGGTGQNGSQRSAIGCAAGIGLAAVGAGILCAPSGPGDAVCISAAGAAAAGALGCAGGIAAANASSGSGDGNVIPFPKTKSFPKSCPADDNDGGDDDHCYKQYETETEICNEITNRRGAAKGRACHESATQRLAACVRGKPRPPLNTWNN